jgi:hypothetical protein
VTRYRMTAAGIFQKVGPDGELKHAGLDEESYTNQRETWGRPPQAVRSGKATTSDSRRRFILRGGMNRPCRSSSPGR